MQIDPTIIDKRSVYKLLTGAVIPRPIGWISSISAAGIPNLAPFSFFNAMSDDPPHVVFGVGRSGSNNKDTLNNVLETREFVVNMVTEETVERMNKTAEMVEPHINEFELAGLTAEPSFKIRPSRVLESPVSMECVLEHYYIMEGGAAIVIGKVVLFHVHESVLLDDYKINMETYKPIARLAGANYAKLGEVFTIKRPVS